MQLTSYTAQDLAGIFAAFILFLSIFIAPGYIAGYLSDVFEFKKRQSFVQFGIALVLSAAVSPILFFLAYRLFSKTAAQLVLLVAVILCAWLIIQLKGAQRLVKELGSNRYARLGWWIGCIWVIVAALFLVDLQFGGRLYYNIVAYDYSTRVSVINAITRTGVPPANPSYFPGTPQPLTQVYYLWYILCSLIDQLGGRLVDAHAALIASVIWTGLILAAGIALITRLRTREERTGVVWQKAFTGIGLLLVSGLDIFPSSFYILFPKLLVGRIFEGDIEQWNEQITAWIGAITWTPHHVISMLACVLTWMLVASNRGGTWSRQIGISILSGLALASAFGLSVWLTLIFILFWGIWFVVRLVQREPFKNLWSMILPGLVMIIVLLPFLFDLFFSSPTSGSAGQFPLALNVRSFYPVEFIALSSPTFERVLIYLLALPLNYFLELGFFFMVGIIWFQNCRTSQRADNPLAQTETLLFITTATLVTFMRSTVIVNNDFGWRGWMFGQFILLLWGVDVLQLLRDKISPATILILQTPRAKELVRRILSVLMVIGAITTLYDMFFLRAWPMLIDTGIAGFPRVLSPDNHLGERTLAMREAYAFIEDHTPPTSIVQFDPRYTMDRPAGLYRTRGTVVSYHSLYGIPEEVFEPLIASVGSIFDAQNPDWHSLDQVCDQYHINVLIIRDLDPIWSSRDPLSAARVPLYENQFAMVFKCGSENGTE